jgi:hypothetical protein
MVGDCFASEQSFVKTRFGEIVPQQELSVLALIRGHERFIYVYDDSSREELIESIRAQAINPTVNLSWYDAAVLTERARKQATARSND